MTFRTYLILSGLAALAGAGVACTAPTMPGDGGGSSSGSGGGGGLHVGSGGSLLGVGGIPLSVKDAEPTVSCADGVLNADEACDDGNTASGDGCGDNCRYVEPGYVCPDAGQPCRPFAKCGDGSVIFPEQCDDGALAAGDGCSASCKFEIGWTCSGSPSSCQETVCGDGEQEGAETCEEADGMPFDGCSLTCQAEPSCTSDGCSSACGDGLIIGAEECDDGNATGGDGCSESCQTEPGYTCSQPPPCSGADCKLELPIVYRDFTAGHSDFGVDCGAELPGVAEDLLDDAGKPVLADGSEVCIASAASFAEWYTKSENNAEIVGTISLYDNGDGGFVNRFGADGEPWSTVKDVSQTSNLRCTEVGCCTDLGLEDEPWNCCEANDTDCRPCSYDPERGCKQTVTNLDGNPLFFPIDDDPLALADSGAGMSCAKIPQEVYSGGWKWENATLADGAECTTPLHNFHFTSEIAYWFKYTTGMTANLTFVGDDDVWVYVNRRLAVDLGGLHVPVEGSFSLAANGTINMVHGLDNGSTAVTQQGDASDFGLEDGGVYEVKVFHAERKVTGSSFKLTLSGFNTARSECVPVCGDAIIAAGEQCDDGVEGNTGGHNRCNADCTIGDYCGDGIVQTGQEECDDADPNKPSGCAGCRVLVVK